MILYVMQLVPLLLWQTIWLGGFWMFCWRIYACGLQGDLKKNYVSLTLFLVIMAIPLAYSGCLNNRRWGVVIEPSLAIYIGPGNTYPIKTNVLFLTDVRIDRVYPSLEARQEKWFYVVTEHVTGWVPEHAIREY